MYIGSFQTLVMVMVMWKVHSAAQNKKSLFLLHQTAFIVMHIDTNICRYMHDIVLRRFKLSYSLKRRQELGFNYFFVT